MKTYKDAMNELRFSPQQKQEMIDHLMTPKGGPSRCVGSAHWVRRQLLPGPFVWVRLPAAH